MVSACVPCGCLMYHSDNFPQEGELFVLQRGGYGCGGGRILGGVGVLLVFLRDVGQGGTWGRGAAAEVMVFEIHEEPTVGADPLSSVPVRASFHGVEAPFAGYC